MKDVHVDSSKKKIKLEGWLESDEENKSNIPKHCPICGKKLSYTNALQTCGIYFVYCMNLKCRWCDIYEE